MPEIPILERNIDVWQGQDFRQTINISDKNGRAVPLGSYLGEAQVRQDVADKDSSVDATFVVVLYANAWIDALGNVGWAAEMWLPAAQTAALRRDDDQFVYDGWIDNGAGNRLPFVTGSLCLRRRVTAT